MLTLYAAFTLISSLVLVAGTFYAFINLHKPGAFSLTFLLMVQLFWAASSVGEYLAPDFASTLFLFHTKSSFAAFIGPLFLFLMISFSGNRTWLTRRKVLLLLAFPILATVLAWLAPDGLPFTNHNFRLVLVGDLQIIRYDPGVVSLLNFLYAFGCIIGGFILVLRTESKRQRLGANRRIWAIAIFILIFGVGEVVSWVASGLTSGLNISPGLVGIANLPLIYAIFREGLLDISPIAQSTLFANMRDGLLVFDTSGRLVEFNQTARRILDLERDPIGANIEKIMPEWASRSRPELTDTQPFGEIQNMHGIFEVQADVLYNKASKPVGRMISLHDVSSRRRAENLLRLQVTALQASVDAIAIFNPAGHFVWINPSFTILTGYTFEEVRGQNPRLLRSGLQTPEFYANLWQTILSGQSWHGELFNKRKDGSIYPEEQTITPVLNENREITYYVAIKRDISQRKELEGLRKDMTNMFLHDLRTPLNQIMLALSLLSSKDKPEENTELLTIAENGTKRMNEMLNDLLAIGRLEEGQMSVDWVEVNLHELAEEALENQHLQADNQKVQLVNAIAPDFPLVVASAHLLNRVLQNLIANAMRFTPAGGSITVSAAEALGNRVRVEVTDTGKGIDPKIEFKLFEKYASSGGGLGLGLSFCRLAINIHQGKITARNRPQGGAVFTFEIPTGGPDRSTTNSV